MEEVIAYNNYDEFVKLQKNERVDRHMNMRTDDIEGATHKMFKRDRKSGIKVENFFPDLPNVNAFYSKINLGNEAENLLQPYQNIYDFSLQRNSFIDTKNQVGHDQRETINSQKKSISFNPYVRTDTDPNTRSITNITNPNPYSDSFNRQP